MQTSINNATECKTSGTPVPHATTSSYSLSTYKYLPMFMCNSLSHIYISTPTDTTVTVLHTVAFSPPRPRSVSLLL